MLISRFVDKFIDYINIRCYNLVCIQCIDVHYFVIKKRRIVLNIFKLEFGSICENKLKIKCFFMWKQAVI